MPTATKVAKVQELKEQLTESSASLISDYRGITVKDVTELRAALREAEATFTVVKNTLTKLAAVEAGLAELDAILEGPTAITFVKGDVVIAAKRLADAAKRIPSLEIKGGVMEGQIISAEQARALATLESREVLLAKMAGMAKASMSRAAYAFNALQSKFLSLLEAYKEKVPPGEAPALEPEVEEASAPDEAATEGAPSSPEAGVAETDSPDEAEAAEDAGPTETESPDEAEAAEDAGPTETDPPQEEDAADAATETQEGDE